MRFIGLFVSFGFCVVACNHHINRAVKCRNNWHYFRLTNSIKGKVLSFSKGRCGYVAILSNTIIITSNHDTIRVVEFPCESTEYKNADSVSVAPADKVNFDTVVLDLKFDCFVKKTCFGKIIKID